MAVLEMAGLATGLQMCEPNRPVHLADLAFTVIHLTVTVTTSALLCSSSLPCGSMSHRHLRILDDTFEYSFSISTFTVSFFSVFVASGRDPSSIKQMINK